LYIGKILPTLLTHYIFHAMEMYAKEGTTEMKDASFLDWIDLTQDRGRWQAVVNGEAHPRVP